MDKGIIIGTEQEILIRSSLPFVIFRLNTNVSCVDCILRLLTPPEVPPFHPPYSPLPPSEKPGEGGHSVCFTVPKLGLLFTFFGGAAAHSTGE
jgi:hypothetical protein